MPRSPSRIVHRWPHRLHRIAGPSPSSCQKSASPFVSIRTSDIVRDEDILHLYKQAGIQYILLGIESAEPEVLDQIKKDSTPREDLKACRLLKEYGIFSIVAHVVGLRNETWQTFKTAIDQLSFYDGDFVNVTHVTPHNWTPYGEQMKGRAVVHKDLSKWDYRHQVLAQKHLSPWKIFLAVKWLELRVHLRLGRLWAIWKQPDPFLRKQLIWCQLHTTLVWLMDPMPGTGLGLDKLVGYCVGPSSVPHRLLKRDWRPSGKAQPVQSRCAELPTCAEKTELS